MGVWLGLGGWGVGLSWVLGWGKRLYCRGFGGWSVEFCWFGLEDADWLVAWFVWLFYYVLGQERG